MRVLLVATELATNALRYATPPVDVSLSRSTTGWLIDVTDTNPHQPPLIRATSHQRWIGGNGMLIIDRASHHWGWYPTAHHKHVWAVVAAHT